MGSDPGSDDVEGANVEINAEYGRCERNDRPQHQHRHQRQDRRKVVDRAVGTVRGNVFLDQQLDDVSEWLDQPKWAHPVRSQTVLETCDHLALHPHQNDVRDHHDRYKDDDADELDDEARKP